MENLGYISDETGEERLNEERSNVNEEASNWKSNSKQKKIIYIISAILKIILLIILLYIFILSLSFMSIGFTLVSSFAKKGTPVINFLLANPFAALSIGIIATALMQNATATTSILISMVGAKIIPDVKTAIPVIIGANIGTCVTNGLIALTLSDDPCRFQKAFSSATLNDMFNLITTLVILPIDIFSNFLDLTSKAIADLIPFTNPQSMASINFLSFIIDPVCNLFIKLDNNAVERLLNGSDETNIALRCCGGNSSYFNSTIDDATCLKKCSYWCVPMLVSIGDAGTGLFWIIFSIIIIIVCLFGIVKTLSVIIVGPIEYGVKRALNASLTGKFSWIVEILLFLVSFLITIIVQSSNIVIATLVPLCAIDLVTLERSYILILGSNIGTTVTGILTAFTQPASTIKNSLQLAFVYTIFNTIGAILWLPIPKLRFPINLSKLLGKTVFKYHWFVKFYMATVYFIIPLLVFLLSLIPYWIGLAVVGLPLIIFLLFLCIVKIIQKKAPKCLPVFLRDFNWLPQWLRSLKPLDTQIKRVSKCCRCKKKTKFNINGHGSVILQKIVMKDDNGHIRNCIQKSPNFESSRF